MCEKQFIKINLNTPEHCQELLKLLDIYMQDEMGQSSPMPKALAPKIIEGLKQHSAYLGFFACIDGQYAALANCNLNFSTFQAKPLINIHDFIVSPQFRNQGAGHFLLTRISAFAKQEGYCRITLEVRNDNIKAQNLYKKVGFTECNTPMHFWQKTI